MNSTALEMVASPAEDLLDLADEIHELVEIQSQAAELDRVARALRSRIKQALTVAGLGSFMTSRGHKASLFSVTRYEADRKTAERLLSAAVVAEVFRPTSSVSLRVK